MYQSSHSQRARDPRRAFSQESLLAHRLGAVTTVACFPDTWMRSMWSRDFEGGDFKRNGSVFLSPPRGVRTQRTIHEAVPARMRRRWWKYAGSLSRSHGLVLIREEKHIANVHYPRKRCMKHEGMGVGREAGEK